MTVDKRPVNPNWFDQFEDMNLRADHAWLLTLGIQVETIADFGCWTGVEPFALLWTFDASEIAVIEINEEYLGKFKTRIEEIQKFNPECLQGRSIRPCLADMCSPVAALQSNYFDLAFCENVLYNMKIDQPDFGRVQSAINEMARVVRPGGYLIAYEPKMDVKFEEKSIPGFFPMHEALNDPADISSCFIQAGLLRATIDGPRDQSLYIFRKPPAA